MGINETVSDEKLTENLQDLLKCILVDGGKMDTDVVKGKLIRVGEYYDLRGDYENASKSYKAAYQVSRDPAIWEYWASAVKNHIGTLHPEQDKGKIDKLWTELETAYSKLAETGHCKMQDFKMERHVQ